MKRKSSAKRPRPSERASKRRRLRLGWLLSVVSLASISAFAYYFYQYIEGTDRFSVETVMVSGTVVLDEQTVLDQSGITLEHNTLFIREHEIEKRVEKLPYVNKCVVTVTFPDTVNIDVVERSAVATLMINSRSYELDPHGIVLSEYAPDEIPVEPYITNVPELAFVTPGDRLDHPALIRALDVWDAFSTYASKEGIQVSELAAYNEQDIRMYCDDLPYELRWGRGDLERQARRLVIFWRQTDNGSSCKQYLDLRFGQDLACR